ncbi:YvcK family protein [Candidatus Saccharibacteria bacterium]|nr:YvcK family protein [Candidatus Saccharibacteria bacterium]
MKEPFESTGLKIAVIGGGTGSFTLLSALKNHSDNIVAIVNMVDDGGSTGVLRDELGVLPPGDVRQCLVALSNSPKLRDLFNYRFEEGTFSGHAFGNVFLSALEKVNGNFNEAVQTASEILNVKGKVVPATLDDVRLKMEWPDATITLHGERVIDEKAFDKDPRTATLSLVPDATANPQAVKAILAADLVVVAPGDLYTSLGPLLIINEIGKALKETAATVLYVSNLVTKSGQTDGFSVSDHASEIERFAGGQILDYVLYNQQSPNAELAKKYRETENAIVVGADTEKMDTMHYKAVGGNFLGDMAQAQDNDVLPVTRSLIRHDPAVVANAIIELYENVRSRNDT